jgi:formylglycine-generating enzyme required for sulfatase activity
MLILSSVHHRSVEVTQVARRRTAFVIGIVAAIAFTVAAGFVSGYVYRPRDHRAEAPFAISVTQEADGEYLVNSVGMRMKLIPAGTFLMGSQENDERPPHWVKITKPFYIGVYELTEGQWEAVMRNKPSFHGDLFRPVTNVSWQDAQQFCEKLSAKEECSYRLPTEAEWEYACRAGTDTPFFWGNQPPDSFAWFGDNSASMVQRVGQKLPNNWGLYDMAGNASEWCCDAYNYYPSGNLVDPVVFNGNHKVRRGEAYISSVGDVTSCLRSSHRNCDVPATTSNYIGFRVVREK